MSWAKDFKFTVEKPNTEAFAPVGGWNTTVPPVSPWTVGVDKPVLQAYQSDKNLKKSFGIELAKSRNPFEAGCKIFGDETSKALWASINWLSDPIVVSSRDIYLKNIALSAKPLDREQLAAKVLALSEEKIERNGMMIPTIEAKDRVAALKLYSDILGYTGKVEVNNNSGNTVINEMTIKLVKADDKKQVIIDNAPNVKSEMPINDPSLIQLKLVKAG